MDKCFIVYRFSDAPKKYQKLSTAGGDEDWLVVVDEDFWKDESVWMPNWIVATDSCQHPKIIFHNEKVVIIGSHA